MKVSRAHRLGEPVVTALGTPPRPEGALIPVGTLLVAPGLPPGEYVMMSPETGDEVGILELPEELANARAWKAAQGVPIRAYDEEGNLRDEEELDD